MTLLWVVVIYLFILISIGIYRSRVVSDQTDFMVAGRSVPTWMLVLTLVSTWIGAGSLIGGAGLAYRQGISMLWFSFGAWIGILVVYFLAGRVRRIAEFTLPDILEKRYNAWARILGSICIIIAFTTIVGYQFRGGGMVINIVTGLPTEYGVLIAAVSIILYTAIGGMISIVTLDVFNGIVIIIALFIALPTLFFGVGGMETLKLNLSPDHFTLFGTENIWWAVGVSFPTLFLLLGESTMYQKFFSAKDENTARRSVVGMFFGIVIIETVLCFVSVIGASHFKNLEDTERIILHIARYGGEVGLPSWGGAMLLCAGIAIILSTANSFLLTASTNITRDIYQRFINPNASQSKILMVQRLWIIILGVIAYLLLTQFKTVLEMALTAYTMIGAGITPVLLAAFFWKRITPAGGVAAMAGGMLGTIVPKFFFGLESEMIIFPALGLAFVLMIVVSYLTEPSSQEKIAPFMNTTEGNKHGYSADTENSR